MSDKTNAKRKQDAYDRGFTDAQAMDTAPIDWLAREIERVAQSLGDNGYLSYRLGLIAGYTAIAKGRA